MWFLFGDHLGLTGAVQREAFSLLDGPPVVTSGALLRANVGPTGRLRMRPVRLEAAAASTRTWGSHWRLQFVVAGFLS